MWIFTFDLWPTYRYIFSEQKEAVEFASRMIRCKIPCNQTFTCS